MLRINQMCLCVFPSEPTKNKICSFHCDCKLLSIRYELLGLEVICSARFEVEYFWRKKSSLVSHRHIDIMRWALWICCERCDCFPPKYQSSFLKWKKWKITLDGVNKSANCTTTRFRSGCAPNQLRKLTMYNTCRIRFIMINRFEGVRIGEKSRFWKRRKMTFINKCEIANFLVMLCYTERMAIK